MSKEVAKDGHDVKKKLQRTFGTTSEAAGDCTRATKRKAAVSLKKEPKKPKNTSSKLRKRKPHNKKKVLGTAALKEQPKSSGNIDEWEASCSSSVVSVKEVPKKPKNASSKSRKGKHSQNKKDVLSTVRKKQPKSSNTIDESEASCSSSVVFVKESQKKPRKASSKSGKGKPIKGKKVNVLGRVLQKQPQSSGTINDSEASCSSSVVLVEEAPKKPSEASSKSGQGKPVQDKKETVLGRVLQKQPQSSGTINDSEASCSSSVVLVEEAPKKPSEASSNSGQGKPIQDIKETVLGRVLQKQPQSSGTNNESEASCSTTTSKTNMNRPVEPTAGCSKDVAMDVYINYLEELSQVSCATATNLADHMFDTKYGRFILIARSCNTKLLNIQYSCMLCNLKYEYHYNEMTCTWNVKIAGQNVANAFGLTKKLGKELVEKRAWHNLINETVTILVKDQLISENPAPVNYYAGSAPSKPPAIEGEFGTIVSSSLAFQIVILMGLQDGKNEEDSVGYPDTLLPQLQLVNRSSLGHINASVFHIKRVTDALLRRYVASECLDLQLIFRNDFHKSERAMINLLATKHNLISRCYTHDTERFLLVKKEIDVFKLAKDVAKKGGTTLKYKLFVPEILGDDEDCVCECGKTIIVP